jgi:pyrroloquinoline quinone biosynthesis protein E
LWLLAELTYRCPLHCAFCYNPTDYLRHTGDELGTGEWVDALRQARALGAVQLGFSGGEPLLREDLEELAAEAHRLGYYANLITSGVGLTEARIAALRRGGLDHIQLSMHDISKEINNFITDTNSFALKQRVAAMIKGYGYPMVLNVVLHRYNIEHVAEILDMAEALGADYVELANTQYYGWALVNRAQLLPTREQLAAAEAATNRFRARVGKRVTVYFVVPDYFEARPKACMNGWGSVFMVLAPDGTVLPCHSARVLPGLTFPNVREHPLAWIWQDSPAFNRYRGEDWMKAPCRTCPERAKDFGGCRCQAYLLAGDAAAADPVCSLSPHHGVVLQAIAEAQHTAAGARPILFRNARNSRQLAEAGHGA